MFLFRWSEVCFTFRSDTDELIILSSDDTGDMGTYVVVENKTKLISPSHNTFLYTSERRGVETLLTMAIAIGFWVIVGTAAVVAHEVSSVGDLAAWAKAASKRRMLENLDLKKRVSTRS